jgi:EamA-like transporter family
VECQPAVIVAAFHPFRVLPRIPVVMTGREWGLMGGLAILWGVSFFFSKVAPAELPPFTLVLGRFGIAALALLVAARVGGHAIPRSPRAWAGTPLAVAGMMSTAALMALPVDPRPCSCRSSRSCSARSSCTSR